MGFRSVVLLTLALAPIVPLFTTGVLGAFALDGAASPAATQRGRMRVGNDLACAAPLGAGVKTRRQFCDVLVGTRPSESVSLTIPSHSGTAMLQFDLHNRFTVPAISVTGP